MLRSDMPSVAEVKKAWAKFFVAIGKFDSVKEFMEADYCFACGALDDFGGKPYVERAHITPLCEKGSNEVSNIHLLCETCHKDSEFISGVEYWTWLAERGMLGTILSHSMRSSGGTRNSAIEFFIHNRF